MNCLRQFKSLNVKIYLSGILVLLLFSVGNCPGYTNSKYTTPCPMLSGLIRVVDNQIIITEVNSDFWVLSHLI